MPNFNSPEGELTDVFMTDPSILDQFVGNQLWNWGRNAYLQLGNNSAIPRSSPVQTISGGTNWKQVSGGSHSAAIKTDNTLWLWGNNNWGEIGDNTSTNRSSPVQTVSTGTNWYQVSCGNQHTAAIKTDGSLWTWGGRSVNYGMLGDNTITNKSSPVQTIATGRNWKLVVCGVYTTSAIKTDGTLWIWGFNTSGQLGDNTVANKSSPVQTVSGGTNWKLIAPGEVHTAAIKTDGTLWLWGANTNGQLGDNTVTSRSSPIQTISTGTNWKLVSCGSYHTAAIKTDGTLWTWGHSGYGQLANNSITHRSSPVQTVSGGTNWKSVTSGIHFSTALKTDSSLWAWGRNQFGQLGDNTVTPRSSPIQTIAGGNNWKQIACGSNHALVVTYTES